MKNSIAFLALSATLFTTNVIASVNACPTSNVINRSIMEDFLTKSHWSDERVATGTGGLTISQITLLTDSTHSITCAAPNARRSIPSPFGFPDGPIPPSKLKKSASITFPQLPVWDVTIDYYRMSGASGDITYAGTHPNPDVKTYFVDHGSVVQIDGDLHWIY